MKLFGVRMRKKLTINFSAMVFFILTNFVLVGSSFAESILRLKIAGESMGTISILLNEKSAPNHVERIKLLTREKQYDGVVFHRVIAGFMAQTGDVKHGKSDSQEFNLDLAGTGGSNYPDLKAEFNDIAHVEGVLSMARSQNPDSANSQFFICFAAAPHLDRNYTAFGKVVKGMEFVHQIKKGEGPNGSVSAPADKIISIR